MRIYHGELGRVPRQVNVHCCRQCSSNDQSSRNLPPIPQNIMVDKRRGINLAYPRLGEEQAHR